MDDIVNPDYYKEKPPISHFAFDSLSSETKNEPWVPPESWSVQHASIMSNLVLEDVKDHEFDDKDKKENIIKLYKPNGTFIKCTVPAHTTTYEIFKKLEEIPDIFKYNLTMIRNNHERILGLHEYPVKIFNELVEKMGYTNDDKIDDINYLIHFRLVPNISKPLNQEFKDFSENVALQYRSLETIPIYLYKHVSSIVTLDVSGNSHIELPLDFIQACINLKSLLVENNEYENLPISINCISSLQCLSVSGNYLKNLDHGKLDRLSNLSVLNLTNNRLTDLPASFATCFQHLTTLLISSNDFVTFPTIVCRITSLLHLDISFNKIREFPPEIGQLTNLITLTAIASHIKGALPQSLMKLENLEKLDIRQNFIIDLNVISHLPKLQVLQVDYNSSSIINFEIRNLRELKMYKNHLTHFSLTSPSGGHCLSELNLSNCKLSSLPENLFENTLGLKRLVLDSNTLSTLPSSLGVLQNLTRLSIQNNYLEVLPSEIGKLARLKSIDAQKNNLKVLPKEIWLCAALSTLNCSSNLLGSFPEPYSTEINKNSIEPKQRSIRRLNTSVNGSTTTLVGPQTPLESSQSCDFKPPSFFENPRNHPPPLSLSLRHLFLGDNRLTDDIWLSLSLFSELRTLNLSFNDLYEIPLGGLRHQLYELYLSGNQFTSLPADNLKSLQYLRVLTVNGNKLQTLPAEISVLRKLVILDVGNNMLKYNISNTSYDWNWGKNVNLKYLNFSGNKRLLIQKGQSDPNFNKDGDLSSFSALGRLRVLGLIDVTAPYLGVDDNQNRRVRTIDVTQMEMSYGIADWIGPSDNLSTWDLVYHKPDESLFALFDGSSHPENGCLLTKTLNDNLKTLFIEKLSNIKSEDTVVSAIRQTFLGLQHHLSTVPNLDVNSGASAAVCYISGTQLYVANVGDVLVVISRNNGQAFEITQKHIPLNPSETSRIRSCGGYVSNSGLLKNKLNVSRGFGYFDLVPAVNCNPFVSTIDMSENDEFVIMASRGLWDKMSYQTAVDIARTEKGNPVSAAQKLRDFAITYGANDNLMVMVIWVGDLFDKRDKLFRKTNHGAGRVGSDGVIEDGILVMSNKRRVKEEIPSDSTLARLEREVAPPVSQLALVFTDIKSSTQFWETQPENMRAAIKIHDSIMRRTLRSVGGYEVKTEGDAFMVCFKNITAALLWCFTVQLQLLEADWPAGIIEPDEGKLIKDKDNTVLYNGLSVRMGIHWGNPVSERNPITQRMDYFGPVVNKASRICNVADGGQICVSSDVIAALRNFPSMFDEDVELQDGFDEGSFPVSRDLLQLKKLGFHIVELGEVRLKGLETPENLSLMYPKQLIGRITINEQPPLEQPIVDVSPKPSAINTQIILPVDHIKPATSNLHRAIDPNVVCAMNSIAYRLEKLTSGQVLSQSAIHPYDETRFENISQSNIGLAIDRHLRKEATDEELIYTMDNCVARVENATSSLFMQKIGKFADVLEKLSETIEVDPMHIMKALQMYAELSPN